MAHDIRGYQVTAIDVVYAIGTLALNAHSAAQNKITYANNAANVVASEGGSISGTLATATQANPYVTTLTFATPFIVGANTTDVASVFVRYNYNIL